MATSVHWYGKTFLAAFNKEIDLTADALKCSLHTSSYTPDQAHDYQNDLTNEVAAGSGYSTGGVALTSCALTYNTTTKVLAFDADDASWTTSTITARYAVIYDSTPGSAATNPLICYVDFGENVASSGGTFLITFDAAGIATVTVS